MKVVAVVTDNDGKMDSMRIMLPGEYFVYGCQAHWLNLVATDLSGSHSGVSEKVINVLKTFRMFTLLPVGCQTLG